MKEICKLCGGSEKSFNLIQYKDWVSIYTPYIKLSKGIHRCMLTHSCSYIHIMHSLCG